MSFISPSHRAHSYQNVDSTSRVEGASPHELVNILFEELLLRLEKAVRFAERGETAKMLETRARAASILNALEESLDFDKGGELAIALAIVYREAVRRINGATGAAAADKLRSAREMIEEIALAWSSISPES